MSDLYINIVKGNISTTNKNVKGSLSLPERVSTGDYNELVNKPQINSVELIGNKTGPELRLQNKMDTLSVQDIEKILYLG